MASLAFAASLAATNKLRCQVPPLIGVVRSNLLEPMNFKDNGKPWVPNLSCEQATLPSFLTSNQLDRNALNKNETRLRLFSGTANPALSQEDKEEDEAEDEEEAAAVDL